MVKNSDVIRNWPGWVAALARTFTAAFLFFLLSA